MAACRTTTASSANVFERVDNELEPFARDLTQFLRANEASADKLRLLTKTLYDALKPEDRCQELRNKEDLDEFIIEDFDDEQIWQELELRNQPLLDISSGAVARVAAKQRIDFGVDLEESADEEDGTVNTGESEDDEDDDDDIDEEMDDDEIDLDEASKKTPPLKPKPTRKTVVDDKFFKLGTLEEFLNGEDKKEERRLRRQRKGDGDSGSESESDESIDHFGDIPSEDEGRDAKYQDFFDPIEDRLKQEESDNEENSIVQRKNSAKGRKSVRFADDEVGDDGDGNDDDSEGADEEQSEVEGGGEEDIDDDQYDLRDAEDGDVEEDGTEASLKTAKDLFKDSDEESPDELSSFEKNQKKLREKISKLEDERLAEKEWQMRGEISAKRRPENSLMEEHLDFDHQTRQAPQITRTLTQKLEDWIVQRIKDKAWDDVVRKVKPTEEVFEFRRRLTLDQEKSKIGLAEVYEQEFLKMKEGEKETVNPEHEEIKTAMGSLFKQLDALSNYHFMPRPAQAELRLVNNLPTITVEEVTPATVGDAAMLAPQEIKDKPKREVIAKDERSSTDRNRERRLKKLHQRRKQKFENEKALRRAEKDPKFRERLERKTARENLRNTTNTKVLKTPKERDAALKSSTKFFERLEDQVVNQVDMKKRAKEQREQKRLRVGALKL